MNIRTSPVERSRHPSAKGTRFLWQYSDKWMTESRQEKLMWLRAQMKLTSQCWALKELAKDIWNRPWARKRQVTGRDGWRWRLTVTFPMMKNAAKTIEEKRLATGSECGTTQCLQAGNAKEHLTADQAAEDKSRGDTEGKGALLNWG